MNKKLLIVESPTKAAVIKQFMSSECSVVATSGHIRLLKPTQSSIDIDNEFACNYVIAKNKSKVINEIRRSIKQHDIIYLATDRDREGEGISWHITEVFKEDLLHKETKRMTFAEITPGALQRSLQSSGSLDYQLVSAYQTRTILDFLIGLWISPVMWRHVAYRTSAGRVQGPALRLIVEREHERDQHVPEQYWTIDTCFDNLPELKVTSSSCGGTVIPSGKKYTDRIEVEERYNALSSVESLTIKYNDNYCKSFKSPHPFNTSTLQQEAFNSLGFNTRNTMQIAQQLYEGIDVGHKTIGLVTYPRTDSYNISTAFQQTVEDYFKVNHPALFQPYVRKKYDTLSQESHECIRVTGLDYDVKHLNKHQLSLFNLIRNRTLMAFCRPYKLKYHQYTGYSKDKSVQICFTDTQVLEQGYHTFSNTQLPTYYNLHQDTVLNVSHKLCDHYTIPKPRLTEGSLIKQLTKLGIGRPSTYANIVPTLLKRAYITDTNNLVTTLLGKLVYAFLNKYFNKYINYDFTSIMEKELDSISYGKLRSLDVIKKLWQDLVKQLSNPKLSEVTKEFKQVKIDAKCDLCGADMIRQIGRYSVFDRCSSYPDCKFIAKKKSMGLCPICKTNNLAERTYRGKKFIGCTGYPQCRHTSKIETKSITDLSIKKNEER